MADTLFGTEDYEYLNIEELACPNCNSQYVFHADCKGLVGYDEEDIALLEMSSAIQDTFCTCIFEDQDTLYCGHCNAVWTLDSSTYWETESLEELKEKIDNIYDPYSWDTGAYENEVFDQTQKALEGLSMTNSVITPTKPAVKLCNHTHEENVLADGTTILCSSYSSSKPMKVIPDFGLYADSVWVRIS